ncbi:MAG: hypothetical protein L6Q97_22030 [Thermoanaerobaculia bacterium]|nr:hypothetical protein [Thermoanaerobaculia bacterium]
MDTALAALLDRVWYMDFPPAGTRFAPPYDEAGRLLQARDFSKAYVRLELLERANPASDTLRLLKGYCLRQRSYLCPATGSCPSNFKPQIYSASFQGRASRTPASLHPTRRTVLTRLRRINLSGRFGPHQHVVETPLPPDLCGISTLFLFSFFIKNIPL